jgi:hypothetical protein
MFEGAEWATARPAHSIAGRRVRLRQDRNTSPTKPGTPVPIAATMPMNSLRRVFRSVKRLNAALYGIDDRPLV